MIVGDYMRSNDSNISYVSFSSLPNDFTKRMRETLERIAQEAYCLGEIHQQIDENKNTSNLHVITSHPIEELYGEELAVMQFLWACGDKRYYTLDDIAAFFKKEGYDYRFVQLTAVPNLVEKSFLQKEAFVKEEKYKVIISYENYAKTLFSNKLLNNGYQSILDYIASIYHKKMITTTDLDELRCWITAVLSITKEK